MQIQKELPKEDDPERLTRLRQSVIAIRNMTQDQQSEMARVYMTMNTNEQQNIGVS